MPDVPPANGYGWVLTADGALKIDWIQGLIAPDAVLELLACHCKWKYVVVCKMACTAPTCVSCRLVRTKSHKMLMKLLNLILTIQMWNLTRKDRNENTVGESIFYWIQPKVGLLTSN